MADDFSKRIKKLSDILSKSKKIVILSGAGVSRASGIPDFRSPDGLYNEHDEKYSEYEPEYLLSKQCLFSKPEVFFSYIRDKFAPKDYEPNIAHRFAKYLEKNGTLLGVVTQNIDGLYEKADVEKVFNVHGSLSTCSCSGCKKKYPLSKVFAGQNIPTCDCKQGFIRPDIVLYGEKLPTIAVNKAFSAISDADCLIVMGTSLQVHPVADFASYFQGENIVVINKTSTSLDNWADVLFHEDMTDVLTELKRIGKE